MTQDAVDILMFWGVQIWQFFTAWKIPGTGVTPAGWLLFLLVAPLVWKFIVHTFDSFGGGGK